jgi:lipopolysaccharide biosynthesis protein
MLGDKMAFIGGTIFWARFSHFSTLMDYSLKELSEMCESGKPSEPSYTHAWERLFTLSQMNRIYGVE